MCVGTDTSCYSPVFFYETAQQRVGDQDSETREGDFALGRDPKA